MYKKKILMIAPDFYGIDKSIKDAFVSLGFEVILRNTRRKLNIIEAVSVKFIKKIPHAGYLLNWVLKFFLKMDNLGYVSLIKKIRPDILFVIKGETIFPRTIEFVRKKLGIYCIAYIWDSPFYSYADNSVDIYRRNNFSQAMRFYDHIFVYDPYYVDEMLKRGVTHASYLPLATDGTRYRKIEMAEEEKRLYDFDIVFVGSPFPNRIKILESLTEFNLAVFGDGWERTAPSYYKGRAVGQKVLEIYNSSKIVLNIHDPEATRGVNTRTFDILSCGAFELVDFKPELPRLLRVNEEIVYYTNIENLKKAIRYFLDNPRARQMIAEKGRLRVLAEHTWKHRVEKMTEVFKKEGWL